MKKWVSIFMSIVLAATLVACSSGNEAGPETPASPTQTSSPSTTSSPSPSEPIQEPVTIQYYDWQLTESPTGDIIRKQLDAYMAEHTNVKIEMQAVPTKERGEKLMTMIMGGMTPDVVHINEADLARVVPMSALESLNSHLDSTVDLKNALIPAMVDMATFNGNVYAVPHFASINTLVYNAKHFKDAGLDPDNPPKTFDEFVDIAKKLTRDSNGDGQIDRWGVGLMGAKTTSISFRYWWALWGSGGDILSDDLSKSLLSSPESVEAIAFYTDLVLKHDVVPPGATDVDYTALVNDFIAEKTSMICDGPWQISKINSENPNIELRAAPMPSKPGITSATTGGGGFLAMASISKSKDVAWDLIQYLSNADNHWTYCNEGSFLPCRSDTGKKIKAEGNPLMGEFSDTLAYSRLTPNVEEMSQINTLLAEEIQFVLIKEKTPQEAAESLSARVDELLK